MKIMFIFLHNAFLLLDCVRVALDFFEPSRYPLRKDIFRTKSKGKLPFSEPLTPTFVLEMAPEKWHN